MRSTALFEELCDIVEYLEFLTDAPPPGDWGPVRLRCWLQGWRPRLTASQAATWPPHKAALEGLVARLHAVIDRLVEEPLVHDLRLHGRVVLGECGEDVP